jgi:glycosyltransferase involved in cell wall biosynthesis
LDECLLSVVNQTYKNLEIIVVDDDSTDASKNIINQYQENDTRIKYYYVNKHNAALTRRQGTKRALGTYVCFADADDILHEKYVEALYAAMQKTTVKIASGMIASIMTEGDIIALPEYSGRVTTEDSLLAYFGNNYHSKRQSRHIAQSINAKLFDKSVFDSVDYSVLKTSVLEDNYILAQILKGILPGKIALVDSTIYYYRQNPHSTMGSVLNYMIPYGNKTLSYPQLFERTMDYVANLFDNTDEAILYTNKIRVEEYLSLSEIAVDRNIHLIEAEKALEDAKLHIKTVEDQRDALLEEINNLKNSRTYKLGRAVTYPIRRLKRG